ncbi:helix-turn-helix domain-containing protein [Trinickia soli]|uniref:helix-turn-helix domain-containing protein n=1 Tax=Trinickia soli TaxID=380675 RepID=UPI003FA36C5B
MKNARQPKSTSAEGHGNHIAGALPARKNTVTSSVLAALLEGRTITGMEAVFEQSTTRAAAFVFYLEETYGWVIERRDIAVGTNDGRITWVTAYWLTAAAREAAFAGGARAWIDDVKAAAERRRKGADKAKATAAKLNKMRRIDPRQGDMFGGAHG